MRYSTEHAFYARILTSIDREAIPSHLRFPEFMVAASLFDKSRLMLVASCQHATLYVLSCLVTGPWTWGREAFLGSGILL